MATLGDSPSLYQGQSWANWAERVTFGNNEDGEKEEEETQGKQESDTMKLRKEDMALFGFCPARDDFYLVVCEICGQVVKPQALKSHIELRHAGLSPPKSEKVEKQPKTVSSQDLSSNQFSPNKQQKGGNGISAVPSPKHSMGSSSSTKTHTKHESKSKRNNSMAPVVRVERISPNLVMKRSNTSSANSAGPNNNSCLPVDKKDLPSPQQPPPSISQPPPVGSKKGSPASVETKGKAIPSNSKHKVTKERKLLPCKDRVYDPNKHCGVWMVDLGKPCTRSLTCKSHSLAFRRAVSGRKKNFDELLSDHRAAKEASLKAVQANKISNHPCNSSGNHSSSSVSSKSSSSSIRCSSNSSSAFCKSNAGLLKSKSSSKLSVSMLRSSHLGNSSHGNKDMSHSCESTPVLPPEHTEEKVGNTIKNKTSDSLYIHHHPSPATICTFGARHMGVGFYVFDRKLDHLRTILRTSFLEKSGHPPPSKKLCVESKLPPVPDFSDPSDPYTWVDHSSPGLSGHRMNHASSHCAEVLLETNIPATSVASSDNLANIQTKPNKLKLLNNKQHKDTNSEGSCVNRTSAAPAHTKRKRTASNATNKCSVNNVKITTESISLPLLPVPVNRNAHVSNIKASSIATDHLNKNLVRNNINMSSPTVGNVHNIKNHYPPNSTNAFRDLNLVVTSLDVSNGQIPANTTSAVLGRNIAGIHTITNVASTGLTVSGGLNLASNRVQQHLDKTNTKKNKSSSKAAKASAIQDGRVNMLSSYLPGILASGVIVEGTLTPGALHSTVALPAVVNSGQLSLAAVASSGVSPPTPSPTTPSPLFRSGSLSPQVPSSSPVPNGLGSSPPPTSTIHSSIANHLLSGSTQTISSSGLIGASSPGSELNSIGCQLKGKNSASRHNACPLKAGAASKPVAGLHHLAATPTHLALSRATSVPQRTTKTVAATDITFQQVLSATQLHLPSKSSMRTLQAGTPPPLAMPAQLPLKILTTMPTVSVSRVSPSQQQIQPSFLLQTEDLRHQEVQGSSSLHT